MGGKERLKEALKVDKRERKHAEESVVVCDIEYEKEEFYKQKSEYDSDTVYDVHKLLVNYADKGCYSLCEYLDYESVKKLVDLI